MPWTRLVQKPSRSYLRKNGGPVTCAFLEGGALWARPPPIFTVFFVCFQTSYMSFCRWRSWAILTMVHDSLQKALLHPWPAQRMERTLQHSLQGKIGEDSEHEDFLSFFVGKDPRGLAFIFSVWKRERLGRVLRGAFQGCRRFFYNGGIERAFLRSFQQKSGRGGHAPVLPSFQSSNKDIGRTLCSFPLIGRQWLLLQRGSIRAMLVPRNTWEFSFDVKNG